MDFIANGHRRNPTGIAVVVLLHVLAAGIALQNSTVSLTRVIPGAIDILPAPIPEPKPLPEPLPEPSMEAPPSIAVPPVDLPDFQQPTGEPVLTTRSTTDTVAPPAGTGGGTGTAQVAEPVPKAAPVRKEAVADAKACTRPEYPRNAQRNGDTGTVTLALLIGTDGKVVESKVEKSSGTRELDRAAQAGLSLCRFQPGTVDGVPYQSWTRMQYVWQLDE